MPAVGFRIKILSVNIASTQVKSNSFTDNVGFLRTGCFCYTHVHTDIIYIFRWPRTVESSPVVTYLSKDMTGDILAGSVVQFSLTFSSFRSPAAEFSHIQ